MKRFLLASAALLAFALPAHAQVVTGSGGTASCAGIASTVTASAPVVNCSQTWNNAAVVFTAAKVNVTATASDNASALLDLQTNSVSKFRVNQYGTLELPSSGGISDSGGTLYRLDINGLVVTSPSILGFTGFNTYVPDVRLARDGANILALRNDVAAQTFNIYNTYTDASNYERLAATWSSNVLYLRNQNAGTGSARMMIPVTGATTVALLPSASTAGIGARAFVTDGSTTVILGLGLTVVGGGANKVPVYSDGTNWIVG